ncbi:MAG: M1 family aminopeptidase [Candidatus Sulfotelmatobacter sp.]
MRVILAACLAAFAFRGVCSAQADPAQTVPAQAAPPQAVPAQARQPGPAESLYLQLSSVDLDPERVFKVRDASLDRAAIHITLDDGAIAFTKDVLGRITGAFFEGDGEVLLAPATDVERKQMSLFTGMAILEERFSTAYFRFNDNTAADLQPGLRAPDDAQEFIAHWSETARTLAQADAMRLLASFSGLLPIAGENAAKDSTVTPTLDPDDHMFHARLQGNKLGVFDVFFDSTAEEQVEAGQSRTGADGNLYYDVWTSFSTEAVRRKPVARKEIPHALPAETESREDPVRVRSYLIDARVKPPKEVDGDVTLQLDVVRGGSRFLVFELSRFLQVHTVEADGKAVEFIHNPAVEGTRLARSANDLVAVILPHPARKGQKVSLRFVYGGEVLAEAGRGLLYVGARGTWYPNRGMAMADFDLTFHYPQGWTLLATGKPEPVPALSTTRSQPTPQDADDEQVAHWVSERPIPVAGFDLGKYVRGAAQAGNVVVETYATSGVERDFPSSAPPPTMEIGSIPTSRPHASPELIAPPPAPSPARNATAVAEFTARAVRYYAERFGPFPYSQLALTQVPGRESQGWPGLIFLSSYAFLDQAERESLHMSPAGALVGGLVPAHEAAHQWWGDLIIWATYRDQWFSEGLANYSSLMMLQEKNPAGFRLVMEKYRRDLVEKHKDGSSLEDAGPVTLGGRLLSSHFPQAYEAISYGRGTWLFHMLRSMLQEGAEHVGQKDPSAETGEEPFVRSLLKVRNRYAGKTISTRELLNVFAEDLPPSVRYEGKASLDWFLEGWVNGTSLPRLELQGVKFTAKANASVVSGVIVQKEAPEDLVTFVPVYAVVSGKAPVLVGRVFADGGETPFHLSVPTGTHKLLLDPNGTILTSPK